MGCWQIGGCWSSADETATHKAALHAYLDAGGNFLDTANVYRGDYGTEKFGWSETTIREVLLGSLTVASMSRPRRAVRQPRQRLAAMGRSGTRMRRSRSR